MKRISEGETENCFTWNAENLWQDNTYKNGLLVHEINNTKSGYEYRYEYDQKGHVTRKYGFAGMGDFDFRYTYDANGNLIKEVKKAAYCLSIAMGYYTVGDDDWTDRAMNITETVAYTYDKNGKCTAVERTVTEKGARIGTEKCSFEEDGYPNRREAECLKGGKQVWKLVGERIAQNESKEK